MYPMGGRALGVSTLDLHSWMIPLVGWLVFVAVYDLRTWQVPAWATWPVVTAACIWQAWHGAWAPLLLWVVLFAWDSEWDDMRRLFRRPISAEREPRPILPDGLAWMAHLVALALAANQGQAALAFTLGMTLAHALWKMGRLPGGDAALFIGLFGIFSDPRFFAVAAVVIACITLPRLAWRYAPDLWVALPMCLTGSWLAALGYLGNAVRQKARREPVAYIFSLAGLAAMLIL
jgi:hypothetical protein